jgi:putative ABC transport system permease protein
LPGLHNVPDLTGALLQTTFALRNLSAGKGKLVASVLGVAFAAFLMAVQGGLLVGFTLAASRAADAVNADIWIVPKGVPAFDFVSALPGRYADIALGAPGVTETGLGVAGWTPFSKPDGDRTVVQIIGVDRRFRGSLPDVPKAGYLVAVADSPVVIDHTEAGSLGVTEHAVDRVEARLHRAAVVEQVSGFSSFLGPPLLFASYYDAASFLDMPPDYAAFILVRVNSEAEVPIAKDWLRSRFSNADIWTKAEFSTRSRLFWLIKTGAGGALTLAAVLGFAIGLVVVGQTVYGLTTDAIEEYATLRALGASEEYIRQIVQTQSLTCGVVGGLLGLILVPPFKMLALNLVTWLVVPGWIYVVVVAALFLMCTLAARIGVQPAIATDPARVFRA